MCRPFDDQKQARIRLETSAILLIFEQADLGKVELVSSQMATIEINAIRDPILNSRVRLLLPDEDAIMTSKDSTFERAEQLEALGLKPADAVPIAASEEGLEIFFFPVTTA